VVADQPAREADQDRRQGREPRSLRYVPDGRGRGAAADAPRHPTADRPTAGAACASVRGAGIECHKQRRQGCAMTKAKHHVLCATRWEPIDSAPPAAPIAVRAFCHGRPKTRQWRSPVPQSEENFFLSVNYLTLLDRFLNAAAQGWADRGAYLANAGLHAREGRRRRAPGKEGGEVATSTLQLDANRRKNQCADLPLLL
jgi:hypothetical protein